jgi:translocation and assembly module TamA
LSKQNQIPIFVEATPRKSQQYKFGVGYGTFTGPRFTAESDWRRVTNTGQRFNMQLKISPVLSGLAAKYFIPGNNPLTDQYTLGANFQQFVPKNGRSFSETLSGSYVKSLSEWQYTTSLNYLRERFMINYNPWQSSNLLYPALTLSHIKSDDLLNPHFGSAVSLNVQGSSDKILSQINFIQGDFKAKYVMSPTENSRFIVRGELGYTTVQDLQKLPLTLQFFAGGPNSVRGYRFDSMGPGRYLKVGSVELQHKIIGDWSAGIFYDAGIAANQFNASPQHSRGVGIIYNSMIGPIKLYVDRADSTPGKPLRFDFNIGPEF